jgi:hypothetical protein
MPTKCYDFPLAVLHDSSGQCGRYQTGGICHPEPPPEEPYSQEEADAVEAYHEMVAAGFPGRRIKAEGGTHFTNGIIEIGGVEIEIVPLDSVLGRAILASMEMEGKPN